MIPCEECKKLPNCQRVLNRSNCNSAVDLAFTCTPLSSYMVKKLSEESTPCNTCKQDDCNFAFDTFSNTIETSRWCTQLRDFLYENKFMFSGLRERIKNIGNESM